MSERVWNGGENSTTLSTLAMSLQPSSSSWEEEVRILWVTSTDLRTFSRILCCSFASGFSGSLNGRPPFFFLFLLLLLSLLPSIPLREVTAVQRRVQSPIIDCLALSPPIEARSATRPPTPPRRSSISSSFFGGPFTNTPERDSPPIPPRRSSVPPASRGPSRTLPREILRQIRGESDLARDRSRDLDAETEGEVGGRDAPLSSLFLFLDFLRRRRGSHRDQGRLGPPAT
mmetsp:Transcript_842/g.1310  ORF Transcript_842/g.1310 Transcript_842/m.1310 type:complete len:230 (-) Transcript_842:263-952(-)